MLCKIELYSMATGWIELNRIIRVDDIAIQIGIVEGQYEVDINLG